MRFALTLFVVGVVIYAAMIILFICGLNSFRGQRAAKYRGEGVRLSTRAPQRLSTDL